MSYQHGKDEIDADCCAYCDEEIAECHCEDCWECGNHTDDCECCRECGSVGCWGECVDEDGPTFSYTD